MHVSDEPQDFTFALGLSHTEQENNIFHLTARILDSSQWYSRPVSPLSETFLPIAGKAVLGGLTWLKGLGFKLGVVQDF